MEAKEKRAGRWQTLGVTSGNAPNKDGPGVHVSQLHALTSPCALAQVIQSFSKINKHFPEGWLGDTLLHIVCREGL